MPGGAARRQHNAIELEQLFVSDRQATEFCRSFIFQQPSPQRVSDALRLFHDLLEHEVRKTAALYLLQPPLDSRHALLQPAARQVSDVIIRGRHHRYFTVIEVHDGSRMLECGRGIRGDPIFVLAERD